MLGGRHLFVRGSSRMKFHLCIGDCETGTSGSNLGIARAHPYSPANSKPRIWASESGIPDTLPKRWSRVVIGCGADQRRYQKWRGWALSMKQGTEVSRISANGKSTSALDHDLGAFHHDSKVNNSDDQNSNYVQVFPFVPPFHIIKDTRPVNKECPQ